MRVPGKLIFHQRLRGLNTKTLVILEVDDTNIWIDRQGLRMHRLGSLDKETKGFR